MGEQRAPSVSGDGGRWQRGTSHPWHEDSGQWVPRSALPLPSRSGAPRSRQVTQKSIPGGNVGAGANTPPAPIIFPPCPLSLEEILFQGRSNEASDLCRARLAPL